jgi:integrase
MGTGTKKLKLTKMADGRWRKMYQGKFYYFSSTLSYGEALKKWEAKKVEIDGGADNLPDLSADELKNLTELFPNEKERQEIIQAVKQTNEKNRQALADLSAKATRIDISDLDPDTMTHAEYEEAKKKRIAEQLPKRQPESQVKAYRELAYGKADENTISFHVEDFLKQKRREVSADQLKPCSWDNLRARLKHFTTFCDGKTLTAINSKLLIDFHGYLCGKIEEGKLSKSYSTDCMRDVQCFIRNLWELGLVELPRNINNKKLIIKSPPQKIPTFTREEIKTLLKGAKDKLELCFYLMLNCGMTQQDIADLKQEEIDWDKGIITRKRSKTSDNEGVPEVKYKLWKPTFDLLKKYNSGTNPVIQSEAGKRLVHSRLEGDKIKKGDCVKNWYFRQILKDKITTKPLKLFRKTGASILSEKYPQFGQYYLGHSPRSVADKNYIRPSDKQFDEALAWLGTELGIS